MQVEGLQHIVNIDQSVIPQHCITMCQKHVMSFFTDSLELQLCVVNCCSHTTVGRRSLASRNNSFTLYRICSFPIKNTACSLTITLDVYCPIVCDSKFTTFCTLKQKPISCRFLTVHTNSKNHPKSNSTCVNYPAVYSDTFPINY